MMIGGFEKMEQSKSNNIDDKIKNVLNSKTENIFVSENMFDNIKTEITKKQNTGGFNMKKKIIAISAACVLCIATVTCIAASGRVEFWHSVSSRANDINEFPSEKQIEKEAEFVPKYVKDLSDKYTFMSASVASSEGLDADNKSVIKTKNIYFRYTDGSEDFNNNKSSLIVIAENLPEDIFNDDGDDSKYDLSEYKGIELKYHTFKSVFFPPSYEGKDVMSELTEEEKQLNEEGRLNIAYGSSEVERDSSQTMSWYENGVGYRIMTSNCELAQEEIIEMAHTIIDSK